MIQEFSKDRGWIEVICGAMFSGKTDELMRRLRRAQFAQLRTALFKPAMENRYDEKKVVSHDRISMEAIPIEESQHMIPLVEDVDVIGIDEAQFFSSELIRVCTDLANNGKRIIVCGLDMDFRGAPFGPIPELMARAEFVTKVHAICISCGALANYSSRKTDSTLQIELGETDIYQPLCRRCYNQAHKK